MSRRMYEPCSSRRPLPSRAGLACLPVLPQVLCKVGLDLRHLQARVLERGVAQPESELKSRGDAVGVKVTIVDVQT